jgi:hypothetical protein
MDYCRCGVRVNAVSHCFTTASDYFYRRPIGVYVHWKGLTVIL